MPVVEAVATAAGSKDKGLAKALEAVHVQAVEYCMENNITDPEKIKAIKLGAHRKFVEEYRSSQNEASKLASQPAKE